MDIPRKNNNIQYDRSSVSCHSGDASRLCQSFFTFRGFSIPINKTGCKNIDIVYTPIVSESLQLLRTIPAQVQPHATYELL